MNDNIVLGIDVGIATTGWAIVKRDEAIRSKLKLIDYGAVITKPKLSMNERLKILFDSIKEIIDKHQPTVMAVESLFYFKNQKTIIAVSQARGVILLAAAEKGLFSYDYTPLQVKTAVTGYGRADKTQIQKMVKLIYSLEEVPKPDDVADAIAVATCHCNTY